MATTLAKVLLSGSTNGKAIKVVATSDPGTTVHTAVSGTSSLDEVYVYVTNPTASAVDITIEFGGNTSPDDLHTVTIPAKTTQLVIPGWLLQNALVVKAYAGTANVLLVDGFVNRIS